MVVFLDSVLYRNQSTPLKNINRLESLVHTPNAFGYVFSCFFFQALGLLAILLVGFSKVAVVCNLFPKSSDIKFIHEENICVRLKFLKLCGAMRMKF